eukprot:CAMPEP_0113479356 /NCGR_PEP_ID=MMETSP0014_2-20120614/21263_1 /TAXON_ID=2857 /ORGANISM="Nitzschia sp." /LENGTH=590 /DNA_ID=CAMNT_0000372643 /DNA_START=269 /DNA_END=2038 /DNA_ORIENTATION=- /assembly_acc=CAM_ASM_000159
MASKPGVWSEWPWQYYLGLGNNKKEEGESGGNSGNSGNSKLVMYLPFVAAVLFGRDDSDHWCYHMLCVVALRYMIAQLFVSISRVHALTKHTRIQPSGLTYDQIDREDSWDDYMILQTYTATLVHNLPWLGYNNFVTYDQKGLWLCLIWHVTAAEFLYYWLHRLLHHHYLYGKYHSHHHQSFVTEPITGSVHPFMEHLMYTAVFAVPLLGPHFSDFAEEKGGGHASLTMFYVYLVGFDVLNAIGHCNFEFMPQWLMRIPGVKYLIYSPSFHSLHHSRIHCNFCLFMPIYDQMFGTLHPNSWKLYDDAINGRACPTATNPPDVVFVGHGTTLTSAFHAPFVTRSISSRPFQEVWWMKLLWPFCAIFALGLRLCNAKPYVNDRHRITPMTTSTSSSTSTSSNSKCDTKSTQKQTEYIMETWVTPAFAIQFFFKSQWDWINSKIEESILAADSSGVKVIGLGALNKNEALNGGGKLFVDKFDSCSSSSNVGEEGTTTKQLNVRVVHGNTLTAAAVIQKIPLDVKEVFVTGSTSKLGRAISLYLAEYRPQVERVVMYTQALERFESIQNELPKNKQHLLVHTTKMEAGSNIQHW